MATIKGANSKRSADKVIKGYVYQFCMSLDAWMKLDENELLILEGAEDLDIYKDDDVETIQVKHVQARVSLKSEDILEAISNFWEYRKENPDKQVKFRFITTSLAAKEKGSPFGKEIKGIELWAKPDKTSEEIKSLVSFLVDQPSLSGDLKSYLKSTSDEELQKTFFTPVVWNLGTKPLEVLEENVKRALVCLGLRYDPHIPATDSAKTFPALMLKIIDEIINPKSQGLTQADFHSAYEEQITSFAQQVKKLHSNSEIGSTSVIGQYMAIAEKRELTELATLQTHFTEPPPIYPFSVPRSSLIKQISEITSEKSAAFIIGSSGVGKTTLASHFLENVGKKEKWIDLRGLEPTHIKQILRSLNTFIHLQADQESVIVLDDLDLRKGYRDYEHELKLLLFNAAQNNQKVIITCQTEPPQRLLHDTWLPEKCQIKVNHFSLEEIEEIAIASGCPDTQPASTWANIIFMGTSGHPQLVRAKIQNLKSKDWAFDETDLIGSEAVKKEKLSIREQLRSEIPERARDLAFRLSFTLGTFSKNMIDVLGELDPKINMSGEAFDMLVGPWIEQTTKDRYRVSPLLSNQGEQVFNREEIRRFHAAICIGYLRQQPPLTQSEVSHLLMHGISSREEGVLMLIVQGTMNHLFETSKHETMKYIAEELFWFYLIGKEKNQRIFPENLHVNYMLRLIQYKFFCLSDEGDDASVLAERLLDDMRAAIKVAEEVGGAELLNENCELMAYSTIMMTIEKRVSSSLIVPILPRFAVLTEKYKEKFPLNDPIPSPMWARRTGKDYFDPASMFLEAHSMRGNGTSDLEEFFDSIDKLDDEPKAFMITLLKENPDVVRSLCNNAWTKELFKKDKKDITPLIKIYEKCIIYADKWDIPHLKLHSILTLSVLHDEYGYDMDKAFTALENHKEFLDDFVGLTTNQKAKIYFNNKKYKEAAPLWEQTLSLNQLEDIDRIFTLKNTAVTYAKLNDWKTARSYMQECLDLILNLRDESGYKLEFIDIGLIADIAFADWKLERWKDALKGFGRALKEMEEIKELNAQDLGFTALYARTGHMISWVSQDAEGTQTLDEPPPCCASNPEGSDSFKDFRTKPSVFLWTLLSTAEKFKDVDIGATSEFLKRTQNTNFIGARLLSRSTQLDIAFQNCDFTNAIPLAIDFLRTKTTLDQKRAEGVDTVDVTADQLCEIEELDPILLEHVILHAIFAACIALYIDRKTPFDFIDLWDQQIKDLKLSNSEILKEFLDFVRQHKPQMKPFVPCEDSAVDQCKFVIENIPLLLTPSELDPITLFRLHFYTLSVMQTQNFRHYLEIPLYKAVVEGWKEVAKNKTFALKNPRVNAPRIEELCNTKAEGNLSDIANILLTVSECVNVNLPDSTINYLKEIAQ